jgi:hypothetical protein
MPTTAASKLKPKDRAKVAKRAQAVLDSSAELAIDQAAAMAVEVVRQHRARIAQLNSMADNMMDLLKGFLDGKAEWGKPQIPWMKGDSAADVLNKIAQAVGRLIPLERQAFHMDSDDDSDYRGSTIFNINFGKPPSKQS